MQVSSTHRQREGLDSRAGGGRRTTRHRVDKLNVENHSLAIEGSRPCGIIRLRIVVGQDFRARVAPCSAPESRKQQKRRYQGTSKAVHCRRPCGRWVEDSETVLVVLALHGQPAEFKTLRIDRGEVNRSGLVTTQCQH